MIRSVSLLLACAVTAFSAYAVERAAAQPVPVEGTEQVPNEFGSTFPREITWQADGARMVLVPFGSFTRGLDPAKGGGAAESPEREVTLPSYYIDVTEVSNDQYMKFLRNSSAAKPTTYGNPDLQKPELPVVGVPWDSAQRYAQWAGKQLPTEAMWEKAARGPKSAIYTTGDKVPTPEAVIHGRGSFGLPVPTTQDTGDRSHYGALHMNGNVSEFVSDWYSREYYRDPASATNPAGPSEGVTKSYRGGSYVTRQGELRLTFRNSVDPFLVRDEVGFRTVWIPTPVTSTPTPTPSPVPAPTRKEVADRFIEKLVPYMQKGDPRVPTNMMATKVNMSRGTSAVQFINFTPYRVTLSFFSPNDELVYLYGEPLAELSYRNVMLPNEVDLVGVAWAPGGPRQLIKLGDFRAESKAVVVFSTELFGNVTDMKGVKHQPSDDRKPEQFYSAYSPQWNQLEVHNTLSTPLLLNIEDMTITSQAAVPVGEWTVPANETLRLVLNPGRFRLKPSYFGASGSSGDAVELRINDKAARRTVLLSEDKTKPAAVTVITARKPAIRSEVRETRAIPR